MISLRDCTIPSGPGITVLFGASGSGKSTVLRCFAGLDRPDQGRILFDGEVWCDASRNQFLPARARRVGLVPQDYALFPHLTVERNVAYGLAKLEPAVRSARVGEMLEWLGLGSLGKRLPRELSGGQQQRAALARALAPRPRLLLLDEPLSALDHPTRLRLRRDLRGWLQAAGVPALIVTHDRLEATALGDDLIVMHEGNKVQHGPVREVFCKPASLNVADILAVETVLSGEILETGNGIATVRVNGVPLQALADAVVPMEKEVFVCIRAEDVSLSVAGEQASSPRNRLPCMVVGCTREGPLVRVDLDCGFPLAALLTPQGCDELGLAAGCRVIAMIKVPKIHLIPRSGGG